MTPEQIDAREREYLIEHGLCFESAAEVIGELRHLTAALAAREREVAALREALERVAIRRDPHARAATYVCAICGGRDAGGDRDGEVVHRADCALAAPPQRPATGEGA